MLTVQTQLALCQLTRPFPSLDKPDPRSAQRAPRVWGHGHTKFVLEVVNALPPLYLNFYRKLAMIAKG